MWNGSRSRKTLCHRQPRVSSVRHCVSCLSARFYRGCRSHLPPQILNTVSWHTGFGVSEALSSFAHFFTSPFLFAFVTSHLTEKQTIEQWDRDRNKNVNVNNKNLILLFVFGICWHICKRWEKRCPTTFHPWKVSRLLYEEKRHHTVESILHKKLWLHF